MTLRRINKDLTIGVRVKVEFLWTQPPYNENRAIKRSLFERAVALYVSKFANQIADRLTDKIRRDTDAISKRRYKDQEEQEETDGIHSSKGGERLHTRAGRQDVRVQPRYGSTKIPGGRTRRIL